MNKRLDVVTFGETMVLFTGNQSLPLEYVHQFNKQIGGAESNLSIGLKRLGHDVGWFSMLGEDPFGRYIHNFVRGEGVDTHACLYTDQAPTAVFFKEKLSAKNLNIYYYRKHSAASLLGPDDIDEDYISNARVLHLTGITPALSETCKQAVFHAIKIAKKHGLKIVFDPNIRYKLWDSYEEAREVMLQMAEQSDVILPGLDEAEFLTGKTEPEEIAESLIGNTDKTIVIKLGSKGAYYQNKYKSAYVSGYQVDEIMDPVGAGDGFAAGIISGVLNDEDMESAVKRANAIGAMIVQVNGDIEGLPTKAQVDAYVSTDGIARDVER
ncbi:5-dehydro-2-deoxygluconokinase [Halobacillus dabanensis]|uniref:5-dehydro-2-deoxygluconokinase n=1 Tax=Halobacillus dabanensis TaxID=240302 RepID=A0A1I3RCK8_HALDA|nr:sugar kinase [Halobacillus dabanensis]SFJ44394.1 5-dehydro-2-deoxygluconokinase [Halobacillus dabanensis]